MSQASVSWLGCGPRPSLRQVTSRWVQVMALLLALPRLAAAGSLCPAAAEGPPQSPRLVIAAAGERLVVELFEDAAPHTTRRLVDLVEQGFYDGLTFDYTRPQVELATAEAPGPDGELIRWPQEIDGRALGLDQQRVVHPGEAMDLMQRELLPAFRDGRRQGEVSGRLLSWIERWYADDRAADFLVGASRLEVNEALGYAYEEGLASRPVRRGAVILRSADPGLVTPRLGFLLTDIPDRDGRWMVIGRVVEGLAVAQRLADRPLLGRHLGGRFKPVEPMPIESVRFVCFDQPPSDLEETRP